MPTSIRILGWEANGLRCPDYSVSFEGPSGSVYPVSLLQMPNGTGKTTTLALLRATLSGRAEIERWNANKVRSFQKKRNPQSIGEFRVRLTANGDLVTIALSFDFDEGTVTYKTTSGNGKDTGFRPPRNCREFLNTDFIDFFVFNGELAQQLLDAEYTNAQQVIEYLYKLKYFSGIDKQLQDNWQRTKNSVSAADMTGLTRRKNKLDSLTLRIQNLEAEKRGIEQKLAEDKKTLEGLRQKYEAKLSENEHFYSDFQAKKELYEQTDKHVTTLTQQILRDIRAPHVLSPIFATNAMLLKDNLDKLKLPESTAKEFFQELAAEEYCICGRPLDEEHRDFIKSCASNYLGMDEMSLLNMIKAEIGEHIGTDAEAGAHDFEQCLNSYVDAITQRGLAKTEQDAAEDRIRNGDENLEEAKQRIDQLEEKIKIAEGNLQKYEDKDDTEPDERTFGIEVLKKRQKEAERKFLEVSNTVEIKNKTDLLQAILSEALDIANKEIAQSIGAEANERIASLLPNNDVRIERIDKSLHLQGQLEGSSGENLTIAYAFMATLFNNTERQLPFIVDSPANQVDLRVRGEIAKLIPQLTNQFIAFTISSEREGFIAPLERTATIQHLTLFRTGDEKLEADAEKAGITSRSDDGILVNNKDFFWAFHKDEYTEGEE